MAKSKIISASIAVDIQNLQEVTGAVQGLSKDLSNIPIDKNLETRLKNVEKTVTNVVKQISTMTDKIDVLSKAGGLDPKTLNDLALLTTAISDVRIEVDALATKVNNFSKGISDVGDIGIKKVSENISKEIGNMANNIDTSISNATASIQKGGEKLKKTYEQLLQSVNAEVDVEGIDATKIFKFSDEDDVEAEFKKVKTKLQKDLKDLADTTNKYNELKVSGASADDMAKAAKAQVNALNKLKESFEAFYGMEDFEDRVGENMTKGMTANINEVIKAFPNLQGEVYRTFDEMYDFIDAIMENISNDFTSSINTLKESLKSVSSEVETPAKKSAAETKNKVKSVEKAAASGITTDVVIKEGVGAELIAELKTVIDNLQKYVDKNPVELNAVINPTWGTQQTQKYLKSIREQLSKTKNGKIDENLAARIYGLQDAFGKDFSEALNKSISKLKDSLQKEGFSVGKLKIEDTAVKDFREQLSNEIGAITVDINANILGTTIVDKDKQDVVNKQFEELKALGRLDPDKINNLVKTIKDTGADLDYSDIYKDRLKKIIKGLVDGIYGSVPEAIKKTRYPAGANPLIGEFNDNSARIKSITERIKEGAKGDALHYFNNQLKNLVERQKTILAELQQNVEDVKDTTAEGIKDVIQKIDVANIEVGNATINITNADATFSNITASTPADQTPNAEATLTANRDELVALANQRFKELANSENIDFKEIESLVSDLRKIGVESINPKLANNTVGRTVEAMLKGGYTSALEAFKSTTSHSKESQAKALEAQQMSKFFESFQKLYAMQNVQEEGTGSVKSIQMFVDAIRKSGLNYKVADSYKNNEIGNLIDSMLTNNYKTVAEAIAARDNKSAEQPQNKNIEKATINVTNLTIKGQQNIAEAKQKITSANIEVKNGNTSITGKEDIVKETANNVENTEAILVATRDELVKAANQKFAEILTGERAGNLNFDAIDALVKDLRLAGIDKLNSTKLATTTTTGRIVDAMLKGGYTSALEAFRSTTDHSAEAKAKALEAQQMSKFFERFQKLYAMQTIQEKGTGSEKSIQMFVDAVRKSGVDFKVNSKYQDNEIGQLVNSMLTSGYKTVTEAIAVRDNKPTEESPKKNLEKATINVTNLTIKGQQNIQEVTQRIASANITITKGNISQSTTVSEPVNTEKKNNNTKKEKDDKSQKFIDEYNNNISNRGNESFGDYLLKQGNLLSKILNNNIKVKKKDVSSIESYQQYIDKINKILDSTTDEALKEKLSQIKAQLSADYEMVNKSVSKDNAETIQTSIQDIIENAGSIDEISKTLSAKSSEIDKFLKDIDKINNTIKKNENLNYSLASQKVVEDSQTEITQLKTELENAQKNNDYSAIDVEEITQRILELEAGVNDAITQTVVNKMDVQGLIRKLDNLQIDEVKADPEVVSQVKTLRKRLQDIVDDDAEEMLTEQYKEYAKQVSQLSGTVSKSDRTIFGNFMKELRHKNYQALAQFFSLNDILRYMREAVNVIKQYDSALIEMMKVSDETRASLERYQKTVFDTADAIGSAAITLNQSTADWMRIGESLTEAAESAKAAQILMNVSEFQDINSATQALVSASQAYADLDKMDIVDKINKLGNEFPIATDQLATALQNSAAALTTQGNDLNEALALVVGGNVITQDALKTGTGIRTIALRIAGTKEAKDELAELGEGVDDFVVRTESKTRKLIMDYTAVASNGFRGVDIYDDNGNLRSTYQILQDIADIYKEIQKEDKQAGTNRANALVELLAGKNRSNIAASILTNPDTIREAYEAAQNAEGSAMRENEKYLTSVEAHMTQFKNAVDELINDLVDSGFINDIIDIGTKVINGLDKMVNTIGGFGSLLVIISTIAVGKKGVFGKLYDSIKLVMSVMSTTTDMTSEMTKEFTLASGKVTTLGKALKSLKFGFITAAITIGITAISSYINKVKESIDETRNLATAYVENDKKLKEYTETIIKNHEIIDDENSTTEEIIDAKKQLNIVNTNLMDSYEGLKGRIDLANASLSESLNLIKQIKAEELSKVLGNATEQRLAIINDLADTDSIGDVFRAFNQSIFKALENESQLDRANDFFSNKSYEINKGFSSLLLSGDAYDRYNQLLKEQEKLVQIINDENSSEQDIRDANIFLPEINNAIKEYEKNFNDYTEIEAAYGSNLLDKYSEAFDNIENAYSDYILSSTEDNKNILSNSIKDLYESAAEADKDALKVYFKNTYENFSPFDDWDYEKYINSFLYEKNYDDDGNLVSLTNLGTRKDRILSLGEQTGGSLLAQDWIDYTNGVTSWLDYTPEQSEALNEFKKIVEENKYSAEELVEILIDAGLAITADQDYLNQLLESTRSNTLSKFGEEFSEEYDSLNINTEEQRDIWEGLYPKASSFEEAVKMYTLATSELEEALDASEVLKNMESQYKPAFDAMATAYQAIWSDSGFDISKVTSEQIESVRSQIESINSNLKEAGEEGVDTDVLDDFILKLSDASTDADTAQEAFNNLATAIVDNLNPALSHASGETATLMQKTLTELGVTNAEAVVFSRLGYTAEQYAEAKEEANENGLDLDKEIGDLTTSEIKLIANNEQLMTYYQNRILANSIDIETADDIEGLIELAKALGMAQIGTLNLIDAEKKFNEIQGLKRTADTAGSNAVREAYLQKYEEALAEFRKEAEVDYAVDLQYDANTIPDSSSTSSAPSPQKFDWIERAIKKIQRAVTNLGKVADATYKKWEERLGGVTGKYEKLQEEILLQQQAADAYMQEAYAIGLNPVYMDKVMNGMMDIETVTDETLKEQISDFQELYLNMQPYLMMVWKIILIAGNPQRQLHYNMTMKYA